MMILCYPSKKAIKQAMERGEQLKYIETSMFGNEYPENGTGKVTGCNRPFSPEYPMARVRCFDGVKKDGTPKKAREFFATVELENHVIVGVS